MVPREKEWKLIDKNMSCYEYAPDVFSKLRSLDGFTDNDLKDSMDP
jgi:hypothetical protein